MNKKDASRGGIGFLTALTLVFVALKLAGAITWSWWWVIAPHALAIAVGIVCLALVGLLTLIIPE